MTRAWLWCCGLLLMAGGCADDDPSAVCEEAAQIVTDCILSVAVPGRVPPEQFPDGCSGSLTVCDARCYVSDPRGACDYILRPDLPGDRGEVVAECVALCP
ncbi:MAG: hypothetical protein AAF997_11770 [Myxococcota bacterium]